MHLNSSKLREDRFCMKIVPVEERKSPRRCFEEDLRGLRWFQEDVRVQRFAILRKMVPGRGSGRWWWSAMLSKRSGLLMKMVCDAVEEVRIADEEVRGADEDGPACWRRWSGLLKKRVRVAEEDGVRLADEDGPPCWRRGFGLLKKMVRLAEEDGSACWWRWSGLLQKMVRVAEEEGLGCCWRWSKDSMKMSKSVNEDGSKKFQKEI